MSGLHNCDWTERVILTACGEEPGSDELERHLAGCGHCGQLYGALCRLEDLHMPLAEVPEGVHERILAAAGTRVSARKRITERLSSWLTARFCLVPRLAWATICLVVIGLGLWQYTRSSSQPPPLTGDEVDYSLAVVEMELEALESEIELSFLDMV